MLSKYSSRKLTYIYESEVVDLLERSLKGEQVIHKSIHNSSYFYLPLKGSIFICF